MEFMVFRNGLDLKHKKIIRVSGFSLIFLLTAVVMSSLRNFIFKITVAKYQ